MDITPLFQAKLEMVKNRSKALGDPPPHNPNNTSKSKKKIFPTKKSEYYSKAREIVSTITSLQTYLTENRASYLQTDSDPLAPFKNNARHDCLLTESERDQMDNNVSTIISNCQSKLQSLQSLIESSSSSPHGYGGVSNNLNSLPQLKTHLENVLNTTRDYIKSVGSYYSEMRAIRVRRTLGLQNMSKLSSITTTTTNHRSNFKNNGNGPSRSTSSSSKFSKNLYNNNEIDSHDSGTSSKSPMHMPASAAYLYNADESEELSPEEIQMLEQENAELLNQLHSMADEVDQIQSSVVNIATLQSIFTDKVLEQDRIIESVATTVVNSTENVKGGNEQIRQAIQQNADFRAWVLFFIIVMSLSLLFLDWYND